MTSGESLPKAGYNMPLTQQQYDTAPAPFYQHEWEFENNIVGHPYIDKNDFSLRDNIRHRVPNLDRLREVLVYTSPRPGQFLLLWLPTPDVHGCCEQLGFSLSAYDKS